MDNNINVNDKSVEISEKSGKGFFKKLILFLLAVFTVLKVIEKIKEKKFEAFNSKGRVRKFISICSNKKIDNSEKLDGICIYSLFSKVNVDLTNCKIAEDSFVSIVSFFSIIRVKLPDGLNVKIDGLSCKSCVKNSVKDEENEKGGIYVAYNSNYSKIRIENQ
ncbi:MAG: hypothetical protein K6F93_06490 [Lachnospiraceae bacterium]|nr:hypothetical protein [Lachnospiraceae bacterium]